MSYKDACAYLEIDSGQPKETGSTGTGQSVNEQKWVPKNYSVPAKVWQQKAMEIHREYYQNLYDPRWAEILKYLREERGLKTEIIKLFKLGYNPALKKGKREDWGLPPEKDDQGREKMLWIPEGIVIPWIKNGAILRLRVRLSKPYKNKRYHSVGGSSAAPLILDNQKEHCVVVESDLDAILLFQEAGDYVNPVSLGSTSIRPDLAVMELFKRSTGQKLLSLDNDDAGTSEVFGFWADNIPAAKRWPVPQGKDPGDCLKGGLSIKAWIMAGLGVSLPRQHAGQYKDRTERVYLDVSGETKKYVAFSFDDGKIFDMVVNHTRIKRYKARFGPIEALPDGRAKGTACYFFGEARYILHCWSDEACHIEAYGLSNVAPEPLVEGLKTLAGKHGLELVHDDYRGTRKLRWKDPVPFERLKEFYRAMESIRKFVLEAGAHWI